MKFAVMFLFSLIIPLVSQAVPPSSEEIVCAKEGDQDDFEFTGLLVLVSNVHPNGTKFESLVLRLVGSDFCFVNDENTSEVRVMYASEVQLNPMDLNPEQARRLRSLVRATITVRGGFYKAHTAWHIRPLVVVVKEIKNSKLK